MSCGAHQGPGLTSEQKGVVSEDELLRFPGAEACQKAKWVLNIMLHRPHPEYERLRCPGAEARQRAKWVLVLEHRLRGVDVCRPGAKAKVVEVVSQP